MFLRKILGGLVFMVGCAFVGPTVWAFDTVTGGGSQLIQVTNVDNDNKILLDEILLTQAAPVLAEPVVIGFDDGAAFQQPGIGVISFGVVVDNTTILDTLNDFTDGDTITVTDSVPTETTLSITATTTVGDLESFLDGITGITATFDDASDRIDMTSTEDFTISSDGNLNDIVLNFIPQAALEFSSDVPNLVVASGNFTVSNLTVSSSQITFLLSGSGTLRVQNIGVFGKNFTEKGEFIETRQLEVDFQGSTDTAETFIVDTTDYSAKLNFLGSTAGDDSDIFRIGDTMTASFAPFDFSSRGTFSIDLSSIVGPAAFVPGVDSFVIVADDDDGSQSVPITMTYSTATVTRTITSKLFNIDNQPPGLDFTDFTFVTLPEGKTFAGIDDIITLNMPTETTGDTVFFTADFQDIAGTSFNFVDEPMATQSITLQEVAIDDNGYNKNIIFTDNVGNTTGPFSTNPVGIDLIRPVVSDVNILAITGAPVPGTIGDTIELTVPVDDNVAIGETTRFSIDLSELGGASANFEEISTVQNFAITAGALNDVAYSEGFTVFDKADNTANFTTNSLQIDNKLPDFDTSCGATFTVNDIGDANGIADVTNGGADTVTFLFPDSGLPGCDLDKFTIDFSTISSNVADQLTEQDATGASLVINVAEGSVDNSAYSLPITIIDVNGNETGFSTGTFDIDNDLLSSVELEDKSFANEFSTPDQELHPNDIVDAKVSLFATDLTDVQAKLPEASIFTSLSLVGGSTTWIGDVTVVPGLLARNFRSFEFLITDDAGNVVTLEGTKDFFITNDNRVKKGGGGGSVSLSNLKKKSSFQSFTPNETDEFHDKTWTARKKSATQLRIESLRRRLTRSATNLSRIQHENPMVLNEKRRLWRSRQAAIARDTEPKKLQKGIEGIIFHDWPEQRIAEVADDARGEYRLQSTLNNLKGTFKSTSSNRISQRKAGINKSGKYIRIKR